MNYQDYFRNSDFEDIWAILNGFYLEHEGLKPLYFSLVETIKTLLIEPEYSEPTIQMSLDSDNEIVVKGAPDPQEWLIGREVVIDFSSWEDERIEAKAKTSGFQTFDMLLGREKRELARQSDTATLAAHLLYWSTLYAIKTQGQHRKEFSEWLNSLEKEQPIKYEMEKEYISESFRKKQRKYWRETVANDSAIDWMWNLNILQKKLEYNIGYWRYVQRHVGWQEDVNRMAIAVERCYIDIINCGVKAWQCVKSQHSACSFLKQNFFISFACNTFAWTCAHPNTSFIAHGRKLTWLLRHNRDIPLRQSNFFHGHTNLRLELAVSLYSSEILQ